MSAIKQFGFLSGYLAKSAGVPEPAGDNPLDKAVGEVTDAAPAKKAGTLLESAKAGARKGVGKVFGGFTSMFKSKPATAYTGDKGVDARQVNLNTAELRKEVQ